MNLNEIIEIIPANVFYIFLGMCLIYTLVETYLFAQCIHEKDIKSIPSKIKSMIEVFIVILIFTITSGLFQGKEKEVLTIYTIALSNYLYLYIILVVIFYFYIKYTPKKGIKNDNFNMQ